jgi:lon-related putative ATP-dependent protease
MTPIESLGPKDLKNSVDPDQLGFKTTSDLPDLETFIGQPRAIEAIKFGVGMSQEGYNIFALGPAGTGKQTLVQHYFEHSAEERDTPSDWCYVNNFEEPHRPRALRLPAGKGKQFRHDMEELTEELRNSLRATFEGDDFRAQLEQAQEEVRQQQEKALEEVQEKATERGLSMMRTPSGLVFAPMREGEVISPEEFQKLPEDDREKLEKDIEALQEELQKALRQVPKWQRQVRDQVQDLTRQVADMTVSALIQEVHKQYENLSEVVQFLEEVKTDIVGNVGQIVNDEDDGGESSSGRSTEMMRSFGKPSPMRRYQVNLIVDNANVSGAPVVFEPNPTYQNLLGRVEQIAQMGALTTDFNLIKGGSLHQANGGYLILEARNLLTQQFAWEGLKRALRAKQIKVESPAQMFNLISTVSLEPEPIPLDVKVAILGEPMLYYLLSANDPEFSELFKVAADFDYQMDRDEESQALYAQLIGAMVRSNDLMPFDASAVAAVIERSSRLVGDSQKLVIQGDRITDLLRQADYWAKQDGRKTATRKDVECAIEAEIYRADRIRQRTQEAILRQTILIDTQGEAVGQINGLSVIQFGQIMFGQPNRITARVRLGDGEVIDIEREVAMGGPIHAKGVLILSGYLGARYIHDRPLSMHASLVFEQSYGGVEGDSASSAELYALISALSEAPIRQSLAVTGSVNQQGQVQAIGGVNEKIEGFFDICNQRGLTGDQGVLIPVSNVKHLMLRQDVIDAVEAGQFAIYPVETIDQGIELLTGQPAGQEDEDGNFPADSINGRIQARLREMAEQWAAFHRHGG